MKKGKTKIFKILNILLTEKHKDKKNNPDNTFHV